MSELASRQELLQEAYDDLWSMPRNTEDSPHKSRIALARRIVGCINVLEGECTIVDVGSGPLAVEMDVSQMLAQKPRQELRNRFREKGRMYSLDLSSVPECRVTKVSRRLPLLHVQANAAEIPYQEDFADIVVANHSFDMLGVDSIEFRQSLHEIKRVMKPNGIFLANFHHASLGNRFVERIESGLVHRDSNRHIAEFYDPSRENPYFDKVDSVYDSLYTAGLDAGQIILANDSYDQWWSVEATSLSFAQV